MNPDLKILHRYLLAGSLVVLTLLAALGFINYYITAEFLLETSPTATVINLAGRQRMLSQKLVKEVLLLSRENIPLPEKQILLDRAGATAAQMVRVHDGLQTGNITLNLPANSSEINRQRFRQIAPHISTILKRMSALSKMNAGNRLADEIPPWLIRDLVDSTDNYLESMDEIVAQYASEASQRANYYSWLIFWIVTPLVVGLMLAVMLLYRPIIRRIRGSFEDLEIAHERLQSESAELKKSEQERMLLAGAVEHAAEGILITDPEGALIYINPALERLIGNAKNELLGKSVETLLNGEENSEKFDKEIWPEIRKSGSWNGRLLHMGRNSRKIEVELSVSPIFDQESSLCHYIGIVRDVTHELELEGQLRQSQKMEAIGALAGGIAHDFNNILTPILGYADLAERALAEGTREADYLSKIRNSAFRARDLVSQILLFSRKSEAKKQPIQLKPIIEEVLDLIRSSFTGSVQIQSDLRSDTFPVMADISAMHTVLMNLCVNAGQAMPDGGNLTVILDTPPSTPMNDSSAKQYLRVSVSDTGIGMSEAVRARIFEPFFTTKEIGKGTGLGLSTVYGIVKGLGGFLRVESEEGQGSTFQVILPAADTYLEEPVSESKLPRLPDTANVLVVDDEFEIGQYTREALELLGWRVTVFDHSREALQVFQDEPDAFDIVMTDLNMPGLKGDELGQALRRIRSKIPILLMTGDPQSLTDGFIESAIFDGYLIKPFSLDEMVRAITGAMENQHREGL